MMRHSVVVGVGVVVALAAAKSLVSYADAPPTNAAVATAPVLRSAQTLDARAEPTTAAAPAEITKRADGHYWAEAEVNGRWIHCLVDTGATAVALTQADASRLGLNPASLTYNIAVNTANGATTAAQVDLEYVSVSGARVDHVAAMVVKDGLSQSLLGMTYLGRLARFEATPTTLILRP
ncbi:MAG: TIGR02281 family clan AA aspartic protease [Caulobacteraceae bacterium]